MLIYICINLCDHWLSSFGDVGKVRTHCNTLQHTATHCITLQHTALHCNTLHHTASHCITLQHTAPRCNTPPEKSRRMRACCFAKVGSSNFCLYNTLYLCISQNLSLSFHELECLNTTNLSSKYCHIYPLILSCVYHKLCYLGSKNCVI